MCVVDGCILPLAQVYWNGMRPSLSRWWPKSWQELYSLNWWNYVRGTSLRQPLESAWRTNWENSRLQRLRDTLHTLLSTSFFNQYCAVYVPVCDCTSTYVSVCVFCIRWSSPQHVTSFRKWRRESLNWSRLSKEHCFL